MRMLNRFECAISAWMIFYPKLPPHWRIYSNPYSVCLRDTFIPDGRKLRDPRRLYAPGRMYHIVERKFCRCGRFPPEVRTAIPVDGRFEHIVLLCNATSDHAIIWIERESESAKFQAIYEKFSKEKATHLQTLKGTFIKWLLLDCCFDFGYCKTNFDNIIFMRH
nr:calmodulin-binding heat-shock protein [Ipomoea batatas]